MFLFVILFLLDYLLTYYGIANGIIIEANPLMVWLFKLPLWAGFIIRIAMSFLVIIMFYIGRNAKIYKFAKKFIILVNLLVLSIHISWIIIYL